MTEGQIALASLLLFVLCAHRARTRAMDGLDNGIWVAVGGLAAVTFVGATLAMFLTML